MSPLEKKENLKDIKLKLLDIKEFYEKIKTVYYLDEIEELNLNKVKKDFEELCENLDIQSHKQLNREKEDFAELYKNLDIQFHKQLNREKENFEKLYENLNIQSDEKLAKLDTDINTINTMLDTLEKATELSHNLDEVVAGTEKSKYQRLLQIVSEDNIKFLDERTNQINNFWTELFTRNNNQLNKVEKTKQNIEEIEKLYLKYFTSEDSKPTKIEDINNYYEDFVDKYNQSIKGYTKIENLENGQTKEIKVKSMFDDLSEKKDQTDHILTDLSKYHEKVFGNANNKGLKEELETRLTQFDEIAIEAKKVIGLSSEAGLAGGFTLRKIAVANNKNNSKYFLYASLTLLVLFNAWLLFYTPNISENFDSVLIKTIFSFPIIWMAIISNVNMNKYSRLEEEYAHKESLAKSFERYKTEIEKLNDDEKNNSIDLLYKLMKTNLDAFKINPADTMFLVENQEQKKF